MKYSILKIPTTNNIQVYIQYILYHYNFILNILSNVCGCLTYLKKNKYFLLHLLMLQYVDGFPQFIRPALCCTLMLITEVLSQTRVSIQMKLIYLIDCPIINVQWLNEIHRPSGPFNVTFCSFDVWPRSVLSAY